MENLPRFDRADHAWCDMLASYSADELVAGGVIQPGQWELAMQIVRQQAYVLLVSNCYPARDLNSNCNRSII
jgi:hypothetical protein